MLRIISKRISSNIAGVQMKQVAKYSSGHCDNPQVAVVLSGCGVFDGTEIHEAAAVLSHITRNNATPFIFAPKIPQMHTMNHATGEEDKGSKRCTFAESARIARGEIKPLSELVDNYKRFSAVIFPGGFGVAKNLSDFAMKGPNCTVHPEVVAILQGCHRAKIAMGFACIAPILPARVLCNVTITLGNSSPAESWPHREAIEAAKAMGAVLEFKGVNEISIDRENNIYSTPAYMYNGKFHEVDDGIGNMIKYMMVMLKHGK
ncbi:hypothetical protein GE061_005954 [Apolygus lucorum]|uniref:DJ-1/PfpI domain-containing protein n=1 Tax=Apolygus lucorum TaxID=248454 RepID=A0A8S9WUZ7_APOLU|nr:hypothetical protein GE061_005954 [Apolygus lucorum]